MTKSQTAAGLAFLLCCKKSKNGINQAKGNYQRKLIV